MNTLDQILTLSKELFDDDSLTSGTKLEDANNFDSMNYIQLVIELGDLFNIDIGDDDIIRTTSFEKISSIVDRKRKRE